MSVLSCARTHCENIMCDRYSSMHGYICDECFEELCVEDMACCISQFMHTMPVRGNEGVKKAFFDSKFPKQER